MRGSRHTRAMAIMGLLSLAAAPAATGQELSSRAYHFGAVGLGPGQAVRLNVAHIDPRGPSCAVHLVVYDEQGGIVDQTSTSAKPGAILGINFVVPDSPDRPDTGTELPAVQRAVFRAAAFSRATECAGILAPSLDIYDTATGRTEGVFLPAIQKFSLLDARQ
jgi:hypothetical protein